MRKIKFRAKCLLLGRWMYGSLYIKKSGKVYINSTEVDPKTVGQFTGVRDAEQVEIFEGDIVYQPGYTGPYHQEIVYECGYFVEVLTGGEQDHFGTIEEYRKFIKVVGNIHDNPELLDKKYRL